MRKSSEYSEDERTIPRTFRGRYVFVYPFVKSREWYGLPAEERWRIMQAHIEVGREYPGVDNHTTYSFGLDDQEFVVAFDTDDVGTFLDLVQRLRTTEASRYTVRDTPSFTCIAMSLERALGALDGEPTLSPPGSRRCRRGPSGGSRWDGGPPWHPPAARGTPRGARARLRAADPVMAELIDRAGRLRAAGAGRPDPSDHYGALVRAITGQQLSVLAARAIYTRLTDRFGGPAADTPQEILAEDPEELRAAAGLSRAKTATCGPWPSTCVSGELELERLDELPDEDVIAELVAIKGLGMWTAQMFLMFQLERPDVLPTGDLGIRNAIQRAYGLAEPPTAAEMEAIGDALAPLPDTRQPLSVALAEQRASVGQG